MLTNDKRDINRLSREYGVSTVVVKAIKNKVVSIRATEEILETAMYRVMSIHDYNYHKEELKDGMVIRLDNNSIIILIGGIL